MEIENEIEDMIKVLLRVPIRKRGRFDCTSKRGAIVSYVRSAGLRFAPSMQTSQRTFGPHTISIACVFYLHIWSYDIIFYKMDSFCKISSFFQILFYKKYNKHFCKNIFIKTKNIFRTTFL